MTHEMALRFLARESRTRRRILARSLLDFIFKTPANFRGTRIQGPSRKGDPFYLFLLVPQTDDLSYADYRDFRRLLLQHYCVQVKHQFPGAQDIVGIATESGRGRAGSEDIICLDTREWTPELEKNAADIEKLLKENGLLSERTMRVSVENEYPDVSRREHQQARSDMPGLKGRDRNLPCPCGSGQKYKKCHGK